MRTDRFARRLILVTSVAMILSAACMKEPLSGAADGSLSDTTAGFETLADVPVPISDVPTDVAADVIPDPWTAIPELPPDTAPDPGTSTPDAPSDVAPGCWMVDAGPTGPPGYGEPCTDDCETGTVCTNLADGSQVCEYLAAGNCVPCCEDGDCPAAGSVCLPAVGGNAFCATPCGTGCPDGLICDAGFCEPSAMAPCECAPTVLGATLPCSSHNVWGSCWGQTVCLLAGWTACTAPAPTKEICDGVDNDCDGYTDEAPTFVEAGVAKQPGDPCGLGVCQGGTVICTATGDVTCSTSSLATTELCANGIDEDCSGAADDAAYCTTDDMDGDGWTDADEIAADCDPYDSGYYPGNPYEKCCPPGVPLAACDQNCDGAVTPCAGCDLDFDGYCPPEDCDEGDPTIYPGAPEKCDDGIDQDCGGGDIPCPPGTDIDGDGYRPPFDCAEGNDLIHPYAGEICDNLDNDCDGTTDEGNPGGGGVCNTGVNFCLPGFLVCNHYPGFGAIVECVGSILSQPEPCDGLDNDCDGLTDEDWPELGQACDGPDADCCAFGVFKCASNGAGTVCGVESMTDQFEECNAIDDDCDGATDEDLSCALTDLDGDGHASVADGGSDCNDLDSAYHPFASEDCCLAPAPVAECDMDCDGSVVPCAAGDGDGDGITAAMGDCDDTDSGVYPSAPEKCGDGVDQDCFGGDVDCATVVDNDGDGWPSTVDCDDNDSNINPGAVEVCNCLDDDCDTLVDDGVSATPDPCGPMSPGCPAGQWVCVCDPQSWAPTTICVTSLIGQDELCNGIDDDCDGLTDELWPNVGQPCDDPCQPDGCTTGIVSCINDNHAACVGDLLCVAPTVCEPGVGCVVPP